MAGAFGCADRLFYYPTHAVYSTPGKDGLGFEEVTFSSADGTRLTGWFIPAVGGRAKGTVVHCHGNAENMTSHWQFVSFLPKSGYNVFVFDYRGYGQSDGRPRRRGTVEDACAAVDYVMSRPDVDSGRVALFGQSIGGAIGCVTAAERPKVRCVVLDSAFTSYRSIAGASLRRNFITYIFSWPLSRLLISSGPDPVDYVGKISPRPVLFIHGTEDQIVPLYMSRELCEAAGDPKELYIIEGADHLGASFTHPGPFHARILEFLERSMPVDGVRGK